MALLLSLLLCADDEDDDDEDDDEDEEDEGCWTGLCSRFLRKAWLAATLVGEPTTAAADLAAASASLFFFLSLRSSARWTSGARVGAEEVLTVFSGGMGGGGLLPLPLSLVLMIAFGGPCIVCSAAKRLSKELLLMLLTLLELLELLELLLLMLPMVPKLIKLSVVDMPIDPDPKGRDDVAALGNSSGLNLSS
jgi:hypothetical protein